MRFSIIVVLLLTCHVFTNAQTNNIGIGTTTPNDKAMLHIDAPAGNQGIIVPRMTTANRIAIGPVAGTADAGLLVYDTDDNLFYYWDSNQWVPFPNILSFAGLSLQYDQATQTISLLDQGNVLSSIGIYVDDADADPTNEIQDLGSNINGSDVTVSITGGAGTTFSVNDADADPTNEYNTGFTFNNATGDLTITDGNGPLVVNIPAGSNDWSTTGNAGTTPAANFLGTTDNQDMVVRTNNQERMRVLANGDIHVDGDKPFFIEQFRCTCDNPFRNTGFSTNTWTAVIAGFRPTSNDGNSESTRAICVRQGGTWWVDADLEDPSNEQWIVDVLFIKNQLVDDDRGSPRNF